MYSISGIMHPSLVVLSPCSYDAHKQVHGHDAVVQVRCCRIQIPDHLASELETSSHIDVRLQSSTGEAVTVQHGMAFALWPLRQVPRAVCQSL